MGALLAFDTSCLPTEGIRCAVPGPGEFSPQQSFSCSRLMNICSSTVDMHLQLVAFSTFVGAHSLAWKWWAISEQGEANSARHTAGGMNMASMSVCTGTPKADVLPRIVDVVLRLSE